MQIGKSRTYEEFSRLGRPRIKIQEASRDFTQGGILFPNSEASYLKTKT